MLTDFHGLRATVMGLGSFGGGAGAVRFLAERGANVTVTDLASADELAASLAEIADCPNVTLHLGGHSSADFLETDLVVVSPAVTADNRFVQQARDAAVPVTSEMNLFWERNRGRTICVTGSNGKSTTAALVYAVLTGSDAQAETQRGTERQSQKATEPQSHRATDDNPAAPPATHHSPTHWLGGNIGKSLLPVVDRIRSDDWVILELSSFQLADLAPLRPNPDVAIVTNFSPNHLDRHGTIEAYRHAKQNILCWQTPDRLAILNQNDVDVVNWPTRARRYWFGFDDEGRQGVFAIGFERYKRQALYRNGPREQVLPLGDWLHLSGAHHFANALAATCAALVLESNIPHVASGLSSFRGLPHRLQFVVETAGRRFFNDSKATTPAATLLAVDAFRAPVVLLAGGYDKGLDLSDLARGLVARGVKAVSLLGQTGARLEELIRAADPHGRVATQIHETLDAAFDWAIRQSAPGDVVLLSPGCASYDAFRNYEQRGEAFVQRARAWREEASPRQASSD